MIGTFVNILRIEGLQGLYSGISASLVRQLTYSTVRFGIYEEIKQRAGPNPGATVLVATAFGSGFAGGVAGNFADVLNVRMQNDATLPAHRRKNYKHVFDGMMRLARYEGLSGWFKGWLPNSSRAAVQTSGQLASYDLIKRSLMEHLDVGDTLMTQLSASFLAGLIATTATNPIDVMKTRIISSSTREGIFQFLRNSFRNEGFRWMFKGWVPSLLRIGP
jgi:solute carrier family 25 (mitochondrial dicarboxylate transporter), member 10